VKDFFSGMPPGGVKEKIAEKIVSRKRKDSGEGDFHKGNPKTQFRLPRIKCLRCFSAGNGSGSSGRVTSRPVLEGPITKRTIGTLRDVGYIEN